MSLSENSIEPNKEEIYIKSEQAIHMLFILCAKGNEENAGFIENEIGEIVAALLRAGYERIEIIKAFNDWQDAYEKDNPCIDEHLNKIFDSTTTSRLRNSERYNRLVEQWIENDKNGRNRN